MNISISFHIYSTTGYSCSITLNEKKGKYIIYLNIILGGCWQLDLNLIDLNDVEINKEKEPRFNSVIQESSKLPTHPKVQDINYLNSRHVISKKEKLK